MNVDGVLLQPIARGLGNMQTISSIVYSPHQHAIPVERKTLGDLLTRGALTGRLGKNRITHWDHPFRQFIGAVFMSGYTGIRQLTREAPCEGHPYTELSLEMFRFPESSDLLAVKDLFRRLVRLNSNLSILNTQTRNLQPLTDIDPPTRQLENLAKALGLLRIWDVFPSESWTGNIFMSPCRTADRFRKNAPSLTSLVLERHGQNYARWDLKESMPGNKTCVKWSPDTRRP